MPEPIEIEFVNRDQQLQHLREMRAGIRSARILLFKAGEGMGKSWILKRMQREHHDLPSTLLDLGLHFGQDPVELVRGLKSQLVGVDWAEVDGILAQADQGYMVDFQGYDQRKLLELITARFDLDELRTLCYNLKIDFDDLRGVNKTGKARELILYMNRRPHGLTTLIDEICRARQNIFVGELKMRPVGDLLGFSSTDDSRAKALQLKRLGAAVISALQTFAPDEPAIILLDTYEGGTRSVGEWIGEYLLLPIRQGIVPGVLVVIAGRENPVLDREWRIIAEATELSGLLLPAIHEYWVVRREQPEASFEFAVQYSGGIPLQLAQMADIGERSLQESLRS